MSLTDAIIRQAEYDGKVQKLRDGNGLYCHVLPSGKYWRYDYRYAGKRRTLSIGVYPAVTLKQARIALYAAKAQLAEGIDPSYDKQIKKHVGGDHSFRAIANQWLDVQEWSEGHRRTIENRINKDLMPNIGDKPIQIITAADVLTVLRMAEARGARQTAHRLKTVTSQIMRYAVSVGLIDSDPCRDLRGALKAPVEKHLPAITEREPFGRLLVAIDSYNGNQIIAHALKLAPYLALRPGELRGGEWHEVQGNEWVIPDHRMKRKREHKIPLAPQVVTLLDSLRQYTGGGRLMFPSLRSKGRAISDGTLGSALKQIGYGGDVHVPHGFRSTFSTMAYEAERFREDVIEMQLSHQDKNSVKAAYKRGEHIKERTELMCWWADEVDAMRAEAITRLAVHQ